MAKEYLERLTAFVGETTSRLDRNIVLECKHFFGGAALYADHRICISLTPVGLAIKLPEETTKSLLKDNRAVPLRYFPKGSIKKGYALFPSGVADHSRALDGYVMQSIEYVLTLPKPKKSAIEL